MKIHVFVYKARPASNSPEFGVVGSIYTDVWIKSDNREAAHQTTLTLLLDQGLQPVELINEQEFPLAPPPPLRIDALQNFHEALRTGLSQSIVGSPVEERDDDIVELRPFNTPSKGPTH